MKYWGLVCGALALSCGDGVKSSLFQGEPEFVVEGVLSENPAWRPPASANLRYALFWNIGRLNLTEGVFFEDRTTSQPFRPPERFVMPIYQPPRELGPPGYSLGFLMVYDDVNNNGFRDDNEPFSGGATNTLITYSPEASEIGRSITRVPIKAGYDVLGSPLRCTTIDYPTSGSQCEIPVGGPCYSDTDCPGGACAESVFASQLPGGMCVVLEKDSEVVNNGLPVGAPCPVAARYLPVKGGSWLREIGQDVVGVWLPRCGTDDDCTRPGYHCAQGGGVCLPTPTFDIVVDELQQLPPLCILDFGGGSRG